MHWLIYNLDLPFEVFHINYGPIEWRDRNECMSPEAYTCKASGKKCLTHEMTLQ